MSNRQEKIIVISCFTALFTIVGIVAFWQWKSNQILGFSVSSFNSTLAQSVSSSTGTIRVASLKDRGGNQIDVSSLGGKIFLTIGPGTSKEEFIVCTDRNLSNFTFTGCTRGLPFSGSTANSEVGSSTLQKAHSSGETIIASNQPAVFEQLVDKDTDQNITGSLIIATSSLFIGNGTNTGNKILYANTTAATSTKPRVFYNVSNSLWEISNDGVSTFSISPTSTIISAGKNVNITSSVLGVNETVYIPTINASSTLIISSGTNPVAMIGSTGNLYASGTFLLGGYHGTTTSPNANNTLDLGGYDEAWRNVYASGTIFANGFEIGGVGTTTFTTLNINGAVTSTFRGPLVIGTSTTSYGSKVVVDTQQNGEVGLQIRGTAGQTAALLQLFDSAGSATTSFSNKGALTLGGGTAIRSIYVGSASFTLDTAGGASDCDIETGSSVSGNLPEVNDIIIPILNLSEATTDSKPISLIPEIVTTAGVPVVLFCENGTFTSLGAVTVNYIGIDRE